MAGNAEEEEEVCWLPTVARTCKAHLRLGSSWNILRMTIKITMLGMWMMVVVADPVIFWSCTVRPEFRCMICANLIMRSLE